PRRESDWFLKKGSFSPLLMGYFFLKARWQKEWRLFHQTFFIIREDADHKHKDQSFHRTACPFGDQRIKQNFKPWLPFRQRLSKTYSLFLPFPVLTSNRQERWCYS